MSPIPLVMVLIRRGYLMLKSLTPQILVLLCWCGSLLTAVASGGDWFSCWSVPNYSVIHWDKLGVQAANLVEDLEMGHQCFPLTVATLGRLLEIVLMLSLSLVRTGNTFLSSSLATNHSSSYAPPSDVKDTCFGNLASRSRDVSILGGHGVIHNVLISLHSIAKEISALRLYNRRTRNANARGFLSSVQGLFRPTEVLGITR